MNKKNIKNCPLVSGPHTKSVQFSTWTHWTESREYVSTATELVLKGWWIRLLIGLHAVLQFLLLANSISQAVENLHSVQPHPKNFLGMAVHIVSDLHFCIYVICDFVSELSKIHFSSSSACKPSLNASSMPFPIPHCPVSTPGHT